MKSSINDFFSKCDQIRSRIWSHLLEKSCMESFIFCAAKIVLLCTELDKKHKKKTSRTVKLATFLAIISDFKTDTEMS